MKRQAFREKDLMVVKEFIKTRKEKKLKQKGLNLSWSNWGFGMEKLDVSVARLSKNNIHYIELNGNLYGKDLGYKSKDTIKILNEFGIKVSGICGMVYPYSEFSSNNHYVRQACIDYFRRHIEFCKEVGGVYILACPGAVGRPVLYDEAEFYRAAETIRIVSEDFVKAGIKFAVEPVRRDEVSYCFTFEDAKKLIDEVGHPGCKHIAGDLYHMLHEETHIGETILRYGDIMINLHLADTNRCALGSAMLDLDIVIMALYTVGYNNDQCFCSAEPLGGGSNPYNMMYGLPNSSVLDKLVADTAIYFYEREQTVLNASDDELLREYGG